MPIGSVGGQHGGMKKKTPTDPMPMGERLTERVNPLFTQLNLWCKPDAKKKPPMTSYGQWGQQVESR